MDEHTVSELAYKRGYEQGKQDAMKWIPVTERLPEKVVDVLVIRMGEKPDIEFMLYDGTWVGDTPHSHYVTHWMPLPEPPKGE